MVVVGWGGGVKKTKHLDDFVSAENEPKELRSFEGGKFVKHNDNFNEFIRARGGEIYLK